MGTFTTILMLASALSLASGEQPPSSQPSRVATSQPSASVPRFTDDDLIFLARNARSAFRAKVLGQPERAVRYRPEPLMNAVGVVHLTLRAGGMEKAKAQSEEINVVDASVAAGTLLGRAAIENGLEIPDGGDRWGIEFEWLGPREYLTFPYYEQQGVWTDELLHSFEPAVEGIGVEFRGQRGSTRPSLVVSLGYTPDLALAAAERAIELRNIHKLRFAKAIRYFRFWGQHLWQPDSNVLPIVLRRGDELVLPETVSPKGLKKAIERVGRYLVYRQNSNGEFSHEFVPSSGTYGSGNSARVQLRSLHGLACYAAWSDDRTTHERVVLGIEAFRKHLEPLVVAEKAADGSVTPKQVGLVLAPAGHTGHLEITSRLLSTMTLSQASAKYEKERSSLLDAILASQLDSGLIVMSLNDAPDAGAAPVSDSDCCRALQVLAKLNSLKEDERITSAVDRAARHYLGRYREGLEPMAAAALIRALCLHYEKSNDARLSDMAFFLADRFASLQLGPDNCPYPELAGAINVRKAGEVGVDTADYLAALADAVQLAKRIGDSAREVRYQSAVAAAARFILQLEFREAGCYYVRGTRNAMGGIRAALWDGRLRADSTAMAIESLIRARSILAPDGGN